MLFAHFSAEYPVFEKKIVMILKIFSSGLLFIYFCYEVLVTDSCKLVAFSRLREMLKRPGIKSGSQVMEATVQPAARQPRPKLFDLHRPCLAFD